LEELEMMRWRAWIAAEYELPVERRGYKYKGTDDRTIILWRRVVQERWKGAGCLKYSLYTPYYYDNNEVNLKQRGDDIGFPTSSKRQKKKTASSKLDVDIYMRIHSYSHNIM
jgi:hypothetical protein